MSMTTQDRISEGDSRVKSRIGVKEHRSVVNRTPTPLGRVLVVDDERTIVRFLARILALKGFEVETATSAENAILQVVRSNFDSIISDIILPDMDGIDLLREIRINDAFVPVILMTGRPTVETAAKAVEYGAYRYLTKPVLPAELLTTVSQAVNEHRSLKESTSHLRNRRYASRGNGEADLVLRFENALNTLWIAFQPIVTLRTKRVYAYEALLRNEEPSLSNPLQLLDVAEELERLHELGRLVRDSTARAAANLPARTSLFVNIRPEDLEDEALYDPCQPLCQLQTHVVLEITERASLECVKGLIEKVSLLRKMGFSLALDDLGAGYSGLSGFAMLHPDFVKIDMSLVRDVNCQPIKTSVVRSIVNLCLDCGIEIIAEGVESNAERDCLLRLGCELQQGFLFSRPEPRFVLPDL